MKIFSFLIITLLTTGALAETVNCDIYVKDGYSGTTWKKFASLSKNLVSHKYTLVWEEIVSSEMENQYLVGIQGEELVIVSRRMSAIDNKFIKSNPLSCSMSPSNQANCGDNWVNLSCSK